MFSIGSHQRCLRSLFRNYYSRPSAIIPTRMEHPEPRQNKRSGKLRGNSGRDDAKTRMSKTLSYVLRHGAKDEGLPIRDDGYVRVKDLLASPKFSTLDFPTLEKIVQEDRKQRYHLNFEAVDGQTMDSESWWIRANQGHSLKQVSTDMKPILSASDIPMAVHGTNKKAWELISKRGLSKMNRNHIHLAQGLIGHNIVSGMRNSASIFIYIDLQKAIDAGIEFGLSTNGVVLSAGNAEGIIPAKFFERVEQRAGSDKRTIIPGWEGNRTQVSDATVFPVDIEQLQKQLETTDLKAEATSS